MQRAIQPNDHPVQMTMRQLTLVRPLLIFLLLPTLAHAELGVQAWVQRYNGPGDANYTAEAIGVDSSNNVIVTGGSLGYMTIKYSSAGDPLWTNRYNGPGNSYDHAYAVAVDRSNNVVVTGGGGNGSGYDYATIKYSEAGVPLWTNRYRGPGNYGGYATAIAVDGSNNVAVTGCSVGSGSYYDYATIKYSSSGLPLWTNRYNGPGKGTDISQALTVDASNNVIVAGYSAGSSGVYDYTMIKYSSTAGTPVWTNHYNGPGTDTYGACALAVDASNSLIVTACSLGSDSGRDYATIKYSSAGVPLWTNRYNGPGNGLDLPSSVAVDRDDNVIVTGYSIGSGSGYDYATIKYSSSGLPLWTNRYNGPGNGDDSAGAMKVDGSNNVVVTGVSYSGTQYDFLTIKYSSAGVPLWSNRYHGPGNATDEARAIAVDRIGNVLVTGYSLGGLDDYDFATIKYVCVPSPLLTARPLTNGIFQMEVDDVLQPGTLVIEACTDLAGWLPIFTNTTPTNVLFYTDPDAGNYPGRFYRAYQSP